MRGFLCCAVLAATLIGVTSAQADDANVERLLTAALTRTTSIVELADSDINFNVDHGRVQLTGRCTNPAAKRHVLNLVRFTPGVVSVDDQIQVGQPPVQVAPIPQTPRIKVERPNPAGEMNRQLTQRNRPQSSLSPQRPIRFPSYEERQRTAQLQAQPTQPAKVAAARTVALPPVVDMQQRRKASPAPVSSTPAKRPTVAIDPLVKPASVDRREFTGVEQFPIPSAETAPRSAQPAKSAGATEIAVPAAPSNEIPAELLMASLADSASISPPQADVAQIGASVGDEPATTIGHDEQTMASRVVWVMVSLAAGMFVFVKFFRRAQ